MDPDQPPLSTRKVRFTPRAPKRTRSKTRATARPIVREDNDDSVKAQQLLRHVNELDSVRRRRSKDENTSSIQATFIHGPKQSAATRATSVPQDRSHKENHGSELKYSDDNGEQPVTKEYVEPWDYANSYYPTTLPWRRPYSGDPDILDEAEFGEASEKSELDENAINPAHELGLLGLDEASENPRLLFFQFPRSLPVIKRSASTKGKEKEGNLAALDQKAPLASSAGSKGSSVREASQRLCSLEELPAGNMGKLLVYKSGSVKLKLGDVLFDVSPGTHCAAARDVVAINTKEKVCCAVGQICNLAVVTPAVSDILDSDFSRLNS